MQYSENVLGYIDRFQYYINSPETDKSIYEDGELTLEGSSDGINFKTLWTIDASVISGWNTHTFPATSKPSYNLYRFVGEAKGACRISELKLIGIIYIND